MQSIIVHLHTRRKAELHAISALPFLFLHRNCVRCALSQRKMPFRARKTTFFVCVSRTFLQLYGYFFLSCQGTVKIFFLEISSLQKFVFQIFAVFLIFLNQFQLILRFPCKINFAFEPHAESNCTQFISYRAGNCKLSKTPSDTKIVLLCQAHSIVWPFILHYLISALLEMRKIIKRINQCTDNGVQVYAFYKRACAGRDKVAHCLEMISRLFLALHARCVCRRAATL